MKSYAEMIWQQESCELLIAFFQFYAVRFEETSAGSRCHVAAMSA
jgi:hypothetical protein